jgi:signal transduction histidine kinase
VRDTLADLRTDVSDQRGLVDTLQAFLQRVESRSGLEVCFTDEASARLPVVQEREIWRIAHEAIVNVERHSRAETLTVRWTCDGSQAVLTVADDGRGFSVARSGRMGSYGITGMRERADAIGARLEIDSGPQTGTTVRCRMELG